MTTCAGCGASSWEREICLCPKAPAPDLEAREVTPLLMTRPPPPPPPDELDILEELLARVRSWKVECKARLAALEEKALRDRPREKYATPLETTGWDESGMRQVAPCWLLFALPTGDGRWEPAVTMIARYNPHRDMPLTFTGCPEKTRERAREAAEAIVGAGLPTVEETLLAIQERTGACLFEIAPPATVGQPFWEVTGYVGGPRTGEGPSITDAILDLDEILQAEAVERVTSRKWG